MIVFAYLDTVFEGLSKTTGLQDDLIKVVSSWLICIPLGYIHDLLDNRFLRNMYSLFFGIFLSYMCIKENMFLTLFASISSYFLTVILRKRASIPVFVFNFTILISLHIHRYITDPMGWKMDGTTSLMLIICKLIYFSFFVADGRIHEIPNILEFLGYVYFYPSAIIGPCFSFQIYNEFIQRKQQYAKIPLMGKTKAVLLHLGLAILNGIGFQFIYPLFPVTILQSEWFLNGNIIIQMLAINLLGIFMRFKYFIAWKLAQAGMNATGITYIKEEDFSRIQSMGDRFELEANPRVKTEMWNSSVQLWLKECFYNKLMPKYGQSNALILTFILSALWHGVHPIYYVGFIHWALMNDLTKCFYRARSKFAWIKEPFRTPIFWLVGNTALANVGIAIALLDWNTALNFYKSMNFIPLIVQLSLYIFFKTTHWGFAKEKKHGHGHGHAHTHVES